MGTNGNHQPHTGLLHFAQPRFGDPLLNSQEGLPARFIQDHAAMVSDQAIDHNQSGGFIAVALSLPTQTAIAMPSAPSPQMNQGVRSKTGCSLNSPWL